MRLASYSPGESVCASTIGAEVSPGFKKVDCQSTSPSILMVTRNCAEFSAGLVNVLACSVVSASRLIHAICGRAILFVSGVGVGVSSGVASDAVMIWSCGVSWFLVVTAQTAIMTAIMAIAAKKIRRISL